MTDRTPEELGVAVDGCSAPTFRTPLSAGPRLRARHEPGRPGARAPGRCGRIQRAVAAHPATSQGTGASAPPSCAPPGGGSSKIGAEAIYAVGVPGKDVALAVKIDDGGLRGSTPWSSSCSVASNSSMTRARALGSTARRSCATGGARGGAGRGPVKDPADPPRGRDRGAGRGDRAGPRRGPRAALHALAAERGIEGVARRPRRRSSSRSAAPTGPGFAALDAVHRAGSLDGDGVGPARREVGAGPPVLVEPDRGRLAELLAALDAPHLAWREAALDRLARASSRTPFRRARAALELERAPVAAAELTGLLTRTGLHGGAAAALERLRVLQGSAMEVSWEDWVPAFPLPFDREAIDAVGSAGLPPLLMELVGAARWSHGSPSRRPRGRG